MPKLPRRPGIRLPICSRRGMKKESTVFPQGEVGMPEDFQVGSTSSDRGNYDEENNHPWFETRNYGALLLQYEGGKII
ncbi:hypothetical protein CDL15_Pgr019983 [Punica granatum]|uniref:Uncharacterized protein n=1 Tax=Punica granatum TaxID=22663 RepID=A0A218VQV4_PUNGR|nr:hypothetical protein CDL15_Pgr019983 [Punica granatum]